MAASAAGSTLNNWYGIRNDNNFVNLGSITNAYGIYNLTSFNSGNRPNIDNLYGYSLMI